MAAGAKAPMVITHDGGKRFTAQIRSHRVLVDQPLGAGGDDAGPMPLELLGASLGTCVALYVQQYLLTRGLPFAGMRVEVEQHGAQNPHRVGTFVVRVVLPAEIPESHLVMLERVARSCPAHATLHEGAEVDVQLVAGVGVGAGLASVGEEEPAGA